MIISAWTCLSCPISSSIVFYNITDILQPGQEELIILFQRLYLTRQFLGSVGEPVHFAVNLIVGVELYLVVYLDHHWFYLFQLVPNVREILFLLDLQFEQIWHFWGFLLGDGDVFSQKLGEFFGCRDSWSCLFSWGLFWNFMGERFLKKMFGFLLTDVRIVIFCFDFGDGDFLKSVLLHCFSNFLHDRHEPFAQSCVIFNNSDWCRIFLIYALFTFSRIFLYWMSSDSISTMVISMLFICSLFLETERNCFSFLASRVSVSCHVEISSWKAWRETGVGSDIYCYYLNLEENLMKNKDEIGFKLKKEDIRNLCYMF